MSATNPEVQQWKASYYEEVKKYKELENRFDDNQSFYESKIIKFEFITKQLVDSMNKMQKPLEKFNKKQAKISLLKAELIKKNKEIQDLTASLENAHKKLSRLRKHRHLSLIETHNLNLKPSQEDLKTAKFAETPKTDNLKTPKNPLVIEYQEILIITPKNHYKKQSSLNKLFDLELLLEAKDKELVIEFKKNKELTNENLKLKDDYITSNEMVKSLINDKNHFEKLLDELKKSSQTKIDDFVEKNAFLVRENEDLKGKLYDYQDRETGLNISEPDVTSILSDDLSKFYNGSKLIEKSFDDYSHIQDLSNIQLGENQITIELKRKNHNLEEMLRVANLQCQKLRERLTRYREASEILNLKLKENLFDMEKMKKNYFMICDRSKEDDEFSVDDVKSQSFMSTVKGVCKRNSRNESYFDGNDKAVCKKNRVIRVGCEMKKKNNLSWGL
ncbi:hypothetical protein SteCoe_7721 [Stentor coeruleus]|uniref:Uncharacterized protein n=1 Tax=Stentor coeruleus TaxID=5963 RepID=A0A1R2CLZ3_9CILI|nr:hypothetical protein SteCoe_7721 [Stentor coeruleus]